MVNKLYGDFIDQCIKENHAFANQQDINDGETNTKSATKVRRLGYDIEETGFA